MADHSMPTKSFVLFHYLFRLGYRISSRFEVTKVHAMREVKGICVIVLRASGMEIAPGDKALSLYEILR